VSSSYHGITSAKRSGLATGLVASLVLGACGDAHDPYKDDLTTEGHVLILADEDLRDLVEAERFMFESIYTNAQLDIRYLPEAELLKAVMNDSVRCWIGTVQPGGEQEAYYAQRQVKAHVVPIAMDGIAVVVNKEQPLEKIAKGTLRSILFHCSQKGTTWSYVERREPFADDVIEALCVGSGSGVLRTAFDTLIGDREYGQIHAGALLSLEAVIAQVERDKDYVGLVSFAGLSDLDDPVIRSLRERIRLVPVTALDSAENDNDPDPFPGILPNQSTLADGSYPLRRPVYMVLCEGKSGLGTGFVSFVANHKGQRIILKHGLAPHNVPPREIEIVTQ
jgi:phosphate transport system substrate-binding protein